MNLPEQILRAYLLKNGIDMPVDPRYTLQGVDPAGRVDVAVSAVLERVAGQNMISSALWNVFRPLIDGQLTRELGPAALRPVISSMPTEAQMVLQRFQQ